jgi:23S rRNA (cytidine1920-2'-O)/16S rRNA (cytidine1409-2'-O)-methyltransferase
MVLPSITGFLGEAGCLVALVKPQFEVGREGLGRNGIVKDAKLYPRVETSIRDVCASLGLKVESYIDSPILGSDGNREFFIHATVPQLGLF